MAKMEDLLDLYAEPYDPERPVVCFDETSTQLLAETRPPAATPAGDGRCGRTTSTGGRVPGTCSWPVSPWRVGGRWAVTERRTMQDFSRQMRWLVDEAYPEVEVVRVVLDNLNTHRPASLYETFPAAEARRIARRLEFHYTPKHGSWLNMAEIEFSVLFPFLPEAAALRRGGPPPGSPSSGHGAKRRPGHHQLAVQHPGRTNQTSPPLSFRFHG